MAAAYTQTASSANITQNVVTSQSIKVRILWIADITIATGVNILTSYLSVTGNTRYFGQMVILLVVLARYHLLPYKSTSKAKVNGYEFTRLLPPPKGSGFPPTTTERILFMKRKKEQGAGRQWRPCSADRNGVKTPIPVPKKSG